jgi:hypothetical protein
MIARRAILMLIACAVSGVAASSLDTVPDWLDTAAPVVSLDPVKQSHNELFHVTLSANEPARIWWGVSADSLQQYRRPITVAREGALTLYYYAEDDYGNRSRLDSARYILDTRAPRLLVRPESGRFSEPVIVECIVNEPSRILLARDSLEQEAKDAGMAMRVTDSLVGYIWAVDSAGNRSRPRLIRYIIDTARVSASVNPAGGVFNQPRDIAIHTSGNAAAYYSFDPLASVSHFKRYSQPLRMPYGTSLLRFFARNEYGQESAVGQAAFVLDTVAPRIRIKHHTGRDIDTIILSASESAEIRYALTERAYEDSQRVYRDPITVPRRGRAYIRAVATDSAGNISDLLTWEYRYDRDPPLITASHDSGVYTSPFELRLKADEPADIFYTLDNSPVNESARLYADGIPISRSGESVIRYRAVDRAGNATSEYRLAFYLDLSAPTVRARVEGSVGADQYTVTLAASEPADIYYEIGDIAPSFGSRRYAEPILMSSGQRLRYFAVDKAGNRGEIHVMDELKNPMVHVNPHGGVYNRRLRVSFSTNMESSVMWRLLPDTVFRRFRDSLVLDEEGSYSLEYFSETPGGQRSPIRRDEFRLDWTSPHVTVAVKKGVKDSVSVFFESDENASIYYTTDGSSPLFSRTAKVAGNKFLMSHDRISLRRTADARVAFYAEDVAGNRSIVTIIDVGRPRVVPNIPPGADRVYNRVLSVSLNTLDDRAQIHYERGGKSPSSSSPVYEKPITLMASDTIQAFVIDISGFRGEIDTFVYTIDLPPSAHFRWTPEAVREQTPVLFDASGTIDQESPLSALRYAWDFDGDGVVDTTVEGSSTVSHAYRLPGRYRVRLLATDTRGGEGSFSREIVAAGHCPEGMLFIAGDTNRSFCIDRYEWPNSKGAAPKTNVSWIEARMLCLDEGKRLCTAAEWEDACRGTDNTQFPYGNAYRQGACPAEGEEPFKAGAFGSCAGTPGVEDMIGNVWEWVADRSERYPQMAGGAFGDGRDAHCGKRSVGAMTAKTGNVGFRCCK